MKRRTFSAAAPFAVLGLPALRARAAERVIGWISPESRETTAPFFAAFQAGLKAAMPPGSDTIRVIDRYGVNGPDNAARQVAEMQQQRVSLIVVQGSATLLVMQAKPSVPVVFAFSGDPVVAGIVQSLARPGGNATGMPSCRSRLSVWRSQSPADVQSVVAQALDGGAQALVMLPSASMAQQASATCSQSLGRNVPVVSGWASIARAGALGRRPGGSASGPYKRS